MADRKDDLDRHAQDGRFIWNSTGCWECSDLSVFPLQFPASIDGVFQDGVARLREVTSLARV